MENADPAPGARWYALHIRQRYEKVASSVLRSKGYREFLPLYRTRRQWSDRIAEVELPLFPGYLFCQMNLSDRRIPVVTTPGVLEIVGAAGAPIPVDDREIAAVRRIVDSGFAAEPWPFLPAGSPLRIQHGSLAGVEGILVEARKRHRLVVSITLLQRSVAVEIDSAWVSPLRSPSPDAAYLSRPV